MSGTEGPNLEVFGANALMLAGTGIPVDEYALTHKELRLMLK